MGEANGKGSFDRLVVAAAPKGLAGGRVIFPKVSVGATHNVLMAAALVSVFALTTAVKPEPWYDPRYALPLLGMILGGVAAAWVGARVVGRAASFREVAGPAMAPSCSHNSWPIAATVGRFNISIFRKQA